MSKHHHTENVISVIEEEMTLGGRISSSRQNAGMSLHMAASLLGVRPATLKSWENDRSQPRINKLVALSGIVGVSPTFFIAEEGNDGIAVSAVRGRKDKLVDLLKQEIAAAKQEQRELAQRIKKMDSLIQKL